MKDRSCMPVNRSHRGELPVGNQVVLEIRREGEELSQLKDERWELVRWALWGYIRDASNVYCMRVIAIVTNVCFHLTSEFGWQALISWADLRVDNFAEMIRPIRFFTTMILDADESRT